MAYLLILGATLILLFFINISMAKVPSGYEGLPRQRAMAEYFTFPFYMLALFIILPIVSVLTIFEVLFTREHKIMSRCFAWFDHLIG